MVSETSEGVGMRGRECRFSRRLRISGSKFYLGLRLERGNGNDKQ